MARSISNAKVFVSLAADNLSIALNRRGFASSSSKGVAEMAKMSGRMGKTAQDNLGSAPENSWIPDPVTGYYRPANRPDEVCVAELRAIFLKQKDRSSQ